MVTDPLPLDLDAIERLAVQMHALNNYGVYNDVLALVRRVRELEWKLEGAKIANQDLAVKYLEGQGHAAEYERGRRAGLEEAVKKCNALAAMYPTDVFAPNGDSIDCKSARMARHTCELLASSITAAVKEQGA